MPAAQPLILLLAEEALAWLNEPANSAAWQKLYTDCPWSFPSLAPDYYRIWINHYGDVWAPLLVLAEDNAGSLLGVFPLAVGKGLITGAGAHQAEYQGWLSNEADAVDFLDHSLELLSRTFPSHKLKLRYLVPSIPSRFIEALCHRNSRVIPTHHPRPLMKLDGETIHKALRKKNTRSKINRLRRLGQLEFRRLTDPTEISEKLDEIIGLYDFRQGGANDVCPFLDDPRKKGFLLEWASQAASKALHISCLTLDDEVISAHIGVISDDEIQLAVLAYSPFYSAFSPGKLQVYHAAEMLAKADLAWFDLTPGGDPWKERFASDHDTALSLEVYTSKNEARLVRLRTGTEGMARRLLDWMGISPAKIRVLVRRRPTHGPNRTIFRGREPAFTGARPLAGDGVAYRWNGILPDTKSGFAAVRRNALDDLVRYHPGDHEPGRQAFLREALARLESGDTAYTMRDGDRLACCGWLSLEPGGSQPATIHDLYPWGGYQDCLETLVRGILHDLKEQGVAAVYLPIGPVEQGMPDWVTSLGFEPYAAPPSHPAPPAGK